METKKALLFLCAWEIQSCIYFYVDVTIPTVLVLLIIQPDRYRKGWMDGSADRLMSFVVGYGLLLDSTSVFESFIYTVKKKN